MSRPPKPGQLVNRILDAAAHARLRALRAKLDAYEAAGWQPATYASVDGLTPLHLAAREGKLAVVEFLLAREAVRRAAGKKDAGSTGFTTSQSRIPWRAEQLCPVQCARRCDTTKRRPIVAALVAAALADESVTEAERVALAVAVMRGGDGPLAAPVLATLSANARRLTVQLSLGKLLTANEFCERLFITADIFTAKFAVACGDFKPHQFAFAVRGRESESPHFGEFLELAYHHGAVPPDGAAATNALFALVSASRLCCEATGGDHCDPRLLAIARFARCLITRHNADPLAVPFHDPDPEGRVATCNSLSTCRRKGCAVLMAEMFEWVRDEPLPKPLRCPAMVPLLRLRHRPREYAAALGVPAAVLPLGILETACEYATSVVDVASLLPSAIMTVTAVSPIACAVSR